MVVYQPKADLPIYRFNREHGKGAPRLLYRNLLLPFMGIPKVTTMFTPKPQDNPVSLLQDKNVSVANDKTADSLLLNNE